MTDVLRPGADLARAASYDHALDCMAGFFASETLARTAVEQLRQRHGLHENHGLLLGPAHASWMAFRRQARSWTLRRHADGRSGLSDAPLMATFGGVILGLTILIGVALGGVPDDGLALLLLLMGPLAGAAAGWTAAALTASPAQHRRFNRHVRRQLAAGRWVVLAHQVPLPQQAAAAAVLRERGLGWCAVSAPWRSL